MGGLFYFRLVRTALGTPWFILNSEGEYCPYRVPGGAGWLLGQSRDSADCCFDTVSTPNGGTADTAGTPESLLLGWRT